ncbi:MAG TPA: hypothetical protein VGW39_16510 [Chthoniobacterales bacterium]|nr:hypothetical protein [Chthoniobacterales bacterium]
MKTKQIAALRMGILSTALCFLAGPAHAGYAGYDGGLAGPLVCGVLLLVICGIIAFVNWLVEKIVAWAKKRK